MFTDVILAVVAVLVVVVKGERLCIAFYWKPIRELWSIICHMGSHSVTCHSTQVNVPALTPAKQSGA